MKLLIQGVENAGEPERERVVMRAIEDIDLDNYAVFACKFNDTGPLVGHVSQAYWFGAKRIKSGDLVILYTKVGDEAEKKFGDGNKSHFFYWGWKNNAIWTKDVRPVAVHTEDWNFLEANPATEEPKPKSADPDVL